MYKLIKFGINATITSLKGTQFCLILLALLTMIDFILFLMTIKLPPYIQVVFDTIYAVQSLLYKPNLTVIPVDFTLIVAAIEMLIMAGLIVYILNFIIEFEQVFDKVQKDSNRRFEEKFNKQLKKNADNIEQRNKNFVMLYAVTVEEVYKEYSFEDKKEDPTVKMAEYNTLFRIEMMKNFKVTSQQLPDGNLLFFEDINECNAVFDKIYEFSSKAKENLRHSKLKFNLKTAVCVAGRNDIKDKYVPKLKKLLNIAMPNKVMALGDFKNKYESLKNKPYKVSGLGEYGLNDEIIDVYTLEP